jgi:hypothetical protein
MGNSSRVAFGACFLTMTTVAALLLTWTVWWMAVVGSSVPARRPFYQTQRDAPIIITNVSKSAAEDVFQYALPGGWPTANSALRFIASVGAVLASLSFAFVATFATERATRIYFTIVLLCVALFDTASFVIDAVAIATAARECKSGRCVTAVPEVVRLSGNICKCSPDGWFILTLVMDLVLCVSAITCLILSRGPAKRRKQSRRTASAAQTAPPPEDVRIQ